MPMSPLRKLLLIALLLSGLGLQARDIRLSNDYVVDVQVDAQNRIWVGTLGGLNCFDGIETHQFLKQNGVLPANLINSVCIDRMEPLVWVALQKAGVVCYDLRTGESRSYRASDAENALADDDVTYIVQSEEGDIWMSTFTKGIDRLDRKTGKITHYNDSTFANFNNLATHEFTFRGSQLITGHWADGLTILSLDDHSRMDFHNDTADPASLPSDGIRSLLVDSQGRIWVGTTDGLALYQDNSRDFLVFKHREGDLTSLPGHIVYDLKEDGNGNLLVATDGGGLASLDIREQGLPLESRPFVALSVPGLERNPDIWKIALDRFGNIWVGSYGEGLHFRSHRTVRSGRTLLGATESLEVPCLAATGEGIASCTLDGELISWVGPTESHRVATLKGTGRPLCLLPDSDGRWWLGCEQDGLRVVEHGRDIRVPLGAGVPLPVRALLEDGPNIWVGTDKGLDCIDRRTRRVIHHLLRADGLADNQIRTLCKDDDGLLWVGTYGHGITVLDPQLKVVASYDHNNGLPFDIVNHIIKGAGGRMLVATASGVAVFTSPTEPPIKTLTIQDGLLDDDICALAEDAYGRLWMSCNAGISYLDLNERIYNLDRRDALPDGHYYVGAVAVAPSGRIFFGSSDALAWINPAILSEQISMPPAAFLQPFGADGWTADYRNNYILARFRVPDYTYADNAEYAYRISDLDSQWMPCDEELTFSHLPYGKHTLQVRTRHYAGDWEDNVAEASLTVTPPFWWTWWAWVVYALLAVAAAGIGIRFFSRWSVRKQQDKLERDMLLNERQLGEERLMFYSNVANELRTPVTKMLEPLDALATDQSVPEKARAGIVEAGQDARQLLDLVDQLMEFRKTDAGYRQLVVRRGDLSAFVQDVGDRFRKLLTNPKVKVVTEVEPDIRIWYDDSALRIILNNLLSNAEKFTDEGEITLSLHREWDRVRLSVRDTGCGISEEEQAHIFDSYYQGKNSPQSSGMGIGLALVKKLCELHKIDLSVNSRPGQGSEFRLLLNPAEQYPEALHPELKKPEE